MARRKNPKPLTAVLVAVVVGAAAYGTARWVQSSKPKGATKKPGKTNGTGNGKPSKPGTAGKYVGSGWTGWPHKDLFPSESYFGEGLEVLGYSSGWVEGQSWSALSPQAKAAVKAFQKDWNLVRDAGTFKQGMRLLSEDGLIGTQTTNALYEAAEVQFQSNMMWMDVVAQAKEATA